MGTLFRLPPPLKPVPAPAPAAAPGTPTGAPVPSKAEARGAAELPEAEREGSVPTARSASVGTALAPVSLLVVDWVTSQCVMTTGWRGRSLWVGVDSMARTTFMPLTTRPKTTCLPSRKSAGSVVMKNWQPLVLGPELA